MNRLMTGIIRSGKLKRLLVSCRKQTFWKVVVSPDIFAPRIFEAGTKFGARSPLKSAPNYLAVGNFVRQPSKCHDLTKGSAVVPRGDYGNPPKQTRPPRSPLAYKQKELHYRNCFASCSTAASTKSVNSAATGKYVGLTRDATLEKSEN